MKKKWVIKGKGHINITATHKTTLEFTKDPELTLRGNCIVAVACDKGLKDIPFWLKDHLLQEKKIKIIIKCGKTQDYLFAYGSKDLEFSNKNEIVVRKSSYIDDRTLAIKATKSAIDLERELINEIKKGKEIVIEIFAVK